MNDNHRHIKAAHFQRIRNLTPYGTDKWLYAAIRCANKEEPAQLQLILSALRERTPRDIMRMFPIEKTYDGARWGTKDYLYTMDKAREFGLDRKLGRHVLSFLWDYMSWPTRLLTVCVECSHMARPTKAALMALDSYKRPIQLKLDKVCEAVQAESSFHQIGNMFLRCAGGICVGVNGYSITWDMFKATKDRLHLYLSAQNVVAIERIFKEVADEYARDMEFEYAATAITRKGAKAMADIFAKEGCPEASKLIWDARKRFSPVRYLREKARQHINCNWYHWRFMLLHKLRRLASEANGA